MADYDREMTLEEIQAEFGFAPQIQLKTDYDREMTPEEIQAEFGINPLALQAQQADPLAPPPPPEIEGPGFLERLANAVNPAYPSVPTEGDAARNNMRAQAFGQGLLFDTFDEVEAGIQTAQDKFGGLFGGDGGPGYDARLEALRAQQRQYGEEAPAEQMAMQAAGGLAGAFVPGLNIGIGARAATGAGRLAKAAGAGAVGGGLSGFGAGEGGFAERLGTALPGAALGGVLGAGMQAVPESLSLILGGQGRIKDAAGQRLFSAKDAIDTIPEQSKDPFFKYQTLGELTQDPRLAGMQQELLDTLPAESGARKAFAALERDRRGAQAKFLEESVPVPVRGQEEGGELVRGLLAKQDELLGDDVKAFYNIARDHGEKLAPRSSLVRWIGETSNKYKSGVPKVIKSELFSEIRSPSHVTGRTGERGKFASIDYLESLRKKARNVWSTSKQSGDNEAAAAAQSLIDKIDDVVAKKIPEASKDIRAARQAFAYQQRVFHEGTPGRILAKETTDYKLRSKAAAAAVFDGTEQTTKEMLRALGDNPGDIQKLQGVVRDRALREARDGANDEFLSLSKFPKWLKQNEPALTAKFGNRQLYSKRDINNLRILANDLKLMNPQSDRSIAKLANIGSRGQSTTAPRAIKAASRLVTMGKATPIIDPIFKGLEEVGIKRAQAANEILLQAMTDKDLAKELVQRVSKKNASRVSTIFNRIMGSMVGRSTAEPSDFDPSIFEEKKTEQVAPQVPIADTPVAEPVALKPILGGFEADRLLNAVRKVESADGKRLLSPKGAMGPYQFMPATAKAYGLDDPYDEVASRDAAYRLLQDEYARFKDPRLALAAYNAGATHVNNVIKRVGSRDWDKVAPELYKETSKYVTKVLGAYGA